MAQLSFCVAHSPCTSVRWCPIIDGLLYFWSRRNNNSVFTLQASRARCSCLQNNAPFEGISLFGESFLQIRQLNPGMLSINAPAVKAWKVCVSRVRLNIFANGENSEIREKTRKNLGL